MGANYLSDLEAGGLFFSLCRPLLLGGTSVSNFKPESNTPKLF